MKNYLHILFLIIFCTMFGLGDTLAQTTMSFGYDNAGNRTSRSIKISLKSAKVDSSDLALLKEQTDPQAEKKKEVFEDKLGEQKILIYPNPTKSELKVDITGFDFSKSASIANYNQSGKLIAKKSPLSGSDVMDISSYSDGIYIMRITIGDNVSEWKILKE